MQVFVVVDLQLLAFEGLSFFSPHWLPHLAPGGRCSQFLVAFPATCFKQINPSQLAKISAKNAILDYITQMSLMYSPKIINCLHLSIIQKYFWSWKPICFLCPSPQFSADEAVLPNPSFPDRKGAYLRLHFCHIFILSSLLLYDHCHPIT